MQHERHNVHSSFTSVLCSIKIFRFSFGLICKWLTIIANNTCYSLKVLGDIIFTPKTMGVRCNQYRSATPNTDRYDDMINTSSASSAAIQLQLYTRIWRNEQGVSQIKSFKWCSTTTQGVEDVCITCYSYTNYMKLYRTFVTSWDLDRKLPLR